MFNKKIILIGLLIFLVLLILVTWVILGLDFMGPLKGLAPWKVKNKYNVGERQNEIIFYGASNFARWKDMEKDLPAYKVQNHGFGGSTDKALVYYADKLLYPYHPSVVFFQTGSNDYIQIKGNDEIKVKICMEYKKEIFTNFHEKLPNAKFVVMSGLLLPGRSQYVEITNDINKQLKELCSENDYMDFVDASKMTYDGSIFNKDLFVEDGIHLNSTGQKKWAKEYIIPAIEKVVSELNLYTSEL